MRQSESFLTAYARAAFAAIVIVMLMPLFAAVAFAQGATPTPPNYVEILANSITLVVPLVAPIVVYGVRYALPWIPNLLVPFVALGFGILGDIITAALAGGTSSLLRGALLGAASVFVREVLNTFSQHGFRASFQRGQAIILIGCMVGLVGLQGCATAGKARHAAVIGIAGATEALELIQNTELQLRCGVPAAPPHPYCVDQALHNKITEGIIQAATANKRVANLARLVPEGQPTPPEIASLVVEVWNLVNQVFAMLPDHKGKDALGGTVSVLRNK